MWVVLEWGGGEFPEFVCSGEKQGLFRNIMIHVGLLGDFYPSDELCALGTKRHFYCPQAFVERDLGPHRLWLPCPCL